MSGDHLECWKHFVAMWQKSVYSVPVVALVISRLLIAQVGPDTESEMDRTYRKVLTQLPEGSQCLDDAYGAVQKIVGDFKKYVNVSKQKLQALLLVCNRFEEKKRKKPYDRGNVNRSTISILIADKWIQNRVVTNSFVFCILFSLA